jgi:hypothetical protein
MESGEEINPLKLSAAHLRLLQEARERVNVSFVAIFCCYIYFLWLILMIYLMISAERDSIWATLQYKVYYFFFYFFMHDII